MGGAFVWNHLVQLQRTLPFLKSLYELTRKWIKKPIHSLICEPVCMCVCVCILPKTALQSSIQLLVIHSLICLFARSCVHLFHKSSVFLIPSFIFPAFRSLVPHVPPYVHSGYIIWTNEASKSDDLSVATSLATSGKSFSPVLGTAGLATWSSFSSKVPTSSVCFHTTLSQSISRILKETEEQSKIRWERKALEMLHVLCFFSTFGIFLIESRSCFRLQEPLY